MRDITTGQFPSGFVQGQTPTPGATNTASTLLRETNWVQFRQQLNNTEYAYLLETVYDELRMQYVDFMEREDFWHRVELLYDDVESGDDTASTTTSVTVPSTVSVGNKRSNGNSDGRDTVHKVLKTEEESEKHYESRKNESNPMSSEYEHGETAAPGSGSPPWSPSGETASGSDSPEHKFETTRGSLKRLFSALLYLTEVNNVAHTRGGAQVSQYRRTLAFQSRDILLELVSVNMRKNSEFWEWLELCSSATHGEP